MRQRLREARKTDKGFTLIELLIVIVILGVLSAVVVLAVGAFDDRGEESACKSDVKTVETAVEAYRAKFSNYPDSWEDLENEEFLRSRPTSEEYTITVEWSSGEVSGTLNGQTNGDCELDPDPP